MNRLTLAKFGPIFTGLLLAGCSTAAPSSTTTPAPAHTASATTAPSLRATTAPPATSAPTVPETTAPAVISAPTAALPTTMPARTVVLSQPHDGEPGITITLAASGWEIDEDGHPVKGSEVNGVPEATMLVWSFPAGREFYVWGDPCRWKSTRPDIPATTPAEFAAALAAQASRDATEPMDVTIGGFAGKSLTLHVPDDVVFDDCQGSGFQTYGTDEDPGARSQQGPGQIDELSIVDVNGSTVVIDAMYRPDTSAELIEEMRKIAQSATFDMPYRTHVLADSSNGGVGITVTTPASGWSGDPGSWVMEWGPDGADPPIGAGIITYTVDEEFYVYGDPCAWSSTRPDKPATTVDQIVAALAKQSSRSPSAPEDIAVGGFAGQRITLHVPDDVDFSSCDEGNFATFGVPGEFPALYAQGSGEIDEMWVVDVNGRIALLEGAYYQSTPQNAVDELHAILSSATFD